jgi:hypothetical protein
MPRSRSPKTTLTMQYVMRGHAIAWVLPFSTYWMLKCKLAPRYGCLLFQCNNHDVCVCQVYLFDGGGTRKVAVGTLTKTPFPPPRPKRTPRVEVRIHQEGVLVPSFQPLFLASKNTFTQHFQASTDMAVGLCMSPAWCVLILHSGRDCKRSRCLIRCTGRVGS